MSSTPVKGSPGAEVERMASTPPSSPPSRHEDEDEAYDPRAERMAAEEKRLQQEAKREAAEEKKRSLEWVKAGKGQQTGQFNKLMHLVEQSKVFASVMQKRMHQEESKTQQRSAAEQKKLKRQDEQREQAAMASQRKATRSATKGDEQADVNVSPSKKLPSRGKAAAKDKNGKISDWLDQDQLNEKTGGMTVAEAVAKEAAEHPEAQSGSFGAKNLRSDNQPKEVTGGIMRGYQLEGLYWLRSLYENGLNGILADEMGLGKTIQTISFLAFLREMKSYGPFLIVAPLSTLSNWIDEFARWTPTINTVLYHGTPAEREEIREQKLRKPGTESFPVVCTSYEICMNDRKFLAQYGWKFIIIDEGHRLKNLNCRLIRELKGYHSSNRLLITGTPLQNNLAELWSLLNFLMPQVFDTLENFESFFDFSAVLSKGGHKEIIAQEQQNNLVASLHAILKPFLLRRVKTDVETDLPPKREYILYAPLTSSQKELYKSIIDGNCRSYLEDKAVGKMLENRKSLTSKGSAASLKRKLNGDDDTRSIKSAKSSRESTPGAARQGRRAATRKSYAEVSDREYFHELEQEESTTTSESDANPAEEEERELVRSIQLAKREIASKKLQNPIMQLRLACDSPHNFYWPWGAEQTPDQALVRESGKMLILERLVPYLFRKGHKVLIFSQFKTQLDILEDWARELHGWAVCRVDGGVPHVERQAQIASFNSDKSVQLFLLSTRAGGQGINLAAADTVILFDSDWNPQQDLQAQDRAHRIGQTRPVIVYRLATRGTVEQTLLEKADGKRRLEKLVIRKGKFRSLREAGQDDLDELARLLATEDGEQLDLKGEGAKILSDRDLKVLTDRSKQAYARAAAGEEKGRADLFRVVETQKDVGVLAEMAKT